MLHLNFVLLHNSLQSDVFTKNSFSSFPLVSCCEEEGSNWQRPQSHFQSPY